MRRFTLDNGLDVAILPYGDAPLVRMRYKAKGDSSNIEPTPGLDRYAMSSYTSGRSSTEEEHQSSRIHGRRDELVFREWFLGEIFPRSSISYAGNLKM